MAAIYQWYIDSLIYTVLTTTIYPAEATDAMVLSIAFTGGYMEPVLDEEFNIIIESLDGSITSILLFTGPHDEEFNTAIESLDGSITVILFSKGPYDEEFNIAIESLDGNIESKLVFAEMPDEGMNISIAFIDGSMDLV